jgi:hypothetical protein
MTQELLTPPQELVRQWTALANEEDGCKVWNAIATQAAQWGAGQELEAIIHWLITGPYAFSVLGRSHNNLVHDHRAARRPKPPSLKEQALAALRDSPVDPVDETLQLSADAELIIRRAVEALPND